MEMLTLCDAISVKILSDRTVLASVGNELRVFEEGCDTGITLKWKFRNKIHGIDFDGKQILVYGEREFMVLDYDGEFQLSCRGKISDWISCGKLLSESVNRICLVTGHSNAIALRISENKNSVSVENRSSCVDKSTIYCSTIVGSSSEDCTVFGGTAFGELIIWKPQLKIQNCKALNHVPILHRIACHNGVIFSIDVSLRNRLITTTSDDRSVRFYSFSQNNKDCISSGWSSTNISPLRSVYGHNARVFKAKIIEKDGIPFILSAGEDSYICIWNTSGNLIFKRRHHFGATIWNFDYNPRTEILFTTSSDGNVTSHSIADYFSPIQTKELESSSLGGEYLSKIRFIRHDLIVGITNKNKLVYRKSDDWEIVSNFPGYKCTLLEVSKDLVATAGYKIVTVFQVDVNNNFIKKFEGELASNIIRSFCFLSQNEMLICDEKGACKYSNDNFSSCLDIDIPINKEPWITAALKHGTILVLSNRQGNLFVYKREGDKFHFKSTIKHLHGHLGVTYMCLKNDLMDHCFIRTAGHDSTIKTLKINKTSGVVSVVFTETVPIAWVEKFHEIGISKRNYIIGFNDNHFVIWESKADVVFQVSCGGGHRCWDLIIDEERNFIQLIFIKNRLLYTTVSKLCSNISNRFKMPYYSWHNKSCNIINSLPISDRSFLLVSGGEDNLLKFSKFTVDQPKDICLLQNISLHVSSIKGIEIIRERNKLIIFSCGGRAQICVTEYNIDTESVEERAQFMLKSTDFERKFQRNTQQVDFDPETRFMSIAAVNISGSYDLYLGCSDGFLRKFSYKDGEFRLCDAVFYNRCILHVRTIVLGSQKYLISAATDGCICLWEVNTFNEKEEPVFKIRHHESGANSLDISVIDNNKVLFVTGGDDQDVVVSEVEVNSGHFQVNFTKHFSIHTAQVNGVKISECTKYLYTTSVDQTICKTNLFTMELEKKITNCIADVEGLNLLNVDSCDYCLVYGWGVQICKL